MMKHYLRYKDSGVAWLGKVPEHWEVKKLKYFASTKMSGVDKKTVEGELPVRLCNYTDVYNNEYISDEINFMEATATESEKAQMVLRKGDVLVTKDSETPDDIAIPALVKSDLDNVLCGYHLAQIRADDGHARGEYVFRMFCAQDVREQFTPLANGITRYGLPKYSIDNALFTVPPLPEQECMGSYLEGKTRRLDEFISSRQVQSTLFQKYLVSLIEHLTTKGTNPKAKMKDSGIPSVGDVPAHWDVRRNKYNFREVNERSANGEEELLSVSHITGVTPRSEKNNVNMFLAESMEGYKICRKDDLVINTMWAWMGALGVTRCDGIVSPSYNVYRYDDAEYLPDYLDLFYRTPAYVHEINRFSKGIWSSRLRLYPDAFFDMKTLVPPPDEQREIVDEIKRKMAKIEKFVTDTGMSIEKIQEYRTALISEVVTGKVDVRSEVPA